MRTNADDDWYPSDLATNSYGQGIAATPLQVITAISSLINGGNLMRPYIVEEVSNGGAAARVRPGCRAAYDLSRELRHDEGDDAPGRRWRAVSRCALKEYSAGGKTGTTLVSIPTGYALDSTIASFVGFAPVADPAIIMLIKIDEPKDDPLGGIVAAPVFAKLAPKILAYLNVAPDEPLARAGR